MRRLLLIIALNVGVIQNLVSMERPLDRPDTYSLIDACDVSDSLIIVPAPTDTLYWFFIQQTEETLQSQWDALEPVLEPMLDQTWKNCNNGWVEAPIVYAAKMGLYTFISHVLKKDELIDQALLDQALHGAVLYDHMEIVNLLLKHGANPNGYRLNKAYSQTALEVALVDVYGNPKSNEPNYDLLKTLIRHGARQIHKPHDTAKARWDQCLLTNPDLKTFYEKMILFNTNELSLKQGCILHFVHHHDPAIAQIPIELTQAIIEARQLYQTDQLLYLNKHN